MIALVFVATIVTILYFLVKKNYQYWENRGVFGPKPTFLVGNLAKIFFMKTSPGDLYTRIYDDHPNLSAVGLFRSFYPVLLVRDPELIKEITIKSFSHFRDNDIDIDKKADPIVGRSPFVLKGNEWKTMRGHLTPGFTSGKMKWLYPYLETNAEKLVEFIENTPEASDGRGYEAKELATRFTLNNVANSIFGLEGKCFEEKNSEFMTLARDFLSPGGRTVFLFFIAMIFPPITRFIPIRLISKAVEQKVIELVTSTLKHRQENNIVRNDFLEILSQLKQSSKELEFTDIDVAAQAAGFFGDGYETSSIVMSFTLLELALNRDVQSKLREEVIRAFAENDNKLPYEVVQNLPYLDAVLYESLRTRPPAFFLQKVCTESCTLTMKETQRVIQIDKGTPVIIPTWGIQKDPQYFEDADCFKPERFIGENKEKIQKCTFMPFGEGPRACLGQRFGLLQIKVGLAYIIKNFELSVNEKTQLPLKYHPTSILNIPIGGLWLDFKKTS